MQQCPKDWIVCVCLRSGLSRSGLRLNIKAVFSRYEMSMLKIRRSTVWSLTWIAILVKRHIDIETVAWFIRKHQPILPNSVRMCLLALARKGRFPSAKKNMGKIKNPILRNDKETRTPIKPNKVMLWGFARQSIFEFFENLNCFTRKWYPVIANEFLWWPNFDNIKIAENFSV